MSKQLFYILSILVISTSCGTKNSVDGTVKVDVPSKFAVDVSDSKHEVSIYVGIDPKTLESIESICENQNNEPVVECLERMLKWIQDIQKLELPKSVPVNPPNN